MVEDSQLHCSSARFAPTTALSAPLMGRSRAERGARGPCVLISLLYRCLALLPHPMELYAKGPKALDQQHFRGALVPAAAKFRRQPTTAGSPLRAGRSLCHGVALGEALPLGRRAAADISMVTSRAPAIVALNENRRKQAP